MTRAQVVLQPERLTLSREEREPSLIYDERGRPRLSWARALLLDRHGVDPDLKQLKGLYSNWVNLTEFLLLMKWTGIDKKEFYAVPCAKRGNQIYYWRNQKRFRHLWRKLERMGGSIFDPHGNSKKTNLLFVTLTWDPSDISLRDSWEKELSKQFNKWITAARMKFGRISVLRSWESFESGFPHVQAMLYFHGKQFSAFRHGRKFRIQEKEDLQCGYPSHIDVQAMHSWKGAVGYVGKYILKQLASEEFNEPGAQNKQLLTLSLCWIFRKQSYSMSRDFVDLMQDLHNSKSSWAQMMLDGEPVHETVSWTFIGVFSYKELGIPPILKTQSIEPDSEFWARIEALQVKR